LPVPKVDYFDSYARYFAPHIITKENPKTSSNDSFKEFDVTQAGGVFVSNGSKIILFYRELSLEGEAGWPPGLLFPSIPIPHFLPTFLTHLIRINKSATDSPNRLS